MPDASRLVQSGFLGVDFFFVLSGFLITTLLLREEDRNGRFSLTCFYWRRMLRIVPVYFLVVTAAGVYYVGVKGETEYLDILPYYYLFLSNFLSTDIPLLAPTWSLSVEEQYYLIWPLILLLSPRRYIFHLLFLLIALNVIAVSGGLRIFGIRAFSIEPLVFQMFTATYAPILIGSGLGVLLHSRVGFDSVKWVLGFKKASLLAFLFLLALVNLRPADVTGWPNLLIHFTMAICLSTIVIREDHSLRMVLTFRPVVRVGEISYGIYLYHLIALHAATIVLSKFGLHGGWLTFVIYSVLAVFIAELSFRFYETPFLNLRNRRLRLRRLDN